MGSGGILGCWGYRLKLVYRIPRGMVLPTFGTSFSYKSLQEATQNLCYKIREDSYREYYMGTLKNGTSVLVTVFKKTKCNDIWNSMIRIMPRISHRNLVEYIGYCIEDDQRILVYEFAGTNLCSSLLYTDRQREQLTWPIRASICLGIARGLEYLHHGISPSVVHRDIKPSSIFLDDNFNPRIACFELAVVTVNDLPVEDTYIAGTPGYIAPEHAYTCTVTNKSDVYSFGVVLLEVISGQRSISLGDDNFHCLTDRVSDLLKHSRVMEIVDPLLTEFPDDKVARFINVALLCIQEDPNLRPSMSEVVVMLSGGSIPGTRNDLNIIDNDASSSRVRESESNWATF